MKFIKIILITVLVAILNQSVTFGQENTGQIIGRVISEMTGNPIPGITIRVEGTQSGAMTKNDGTFQIKGLKPGVYAVKYTGIGFNQFIQSNISVTNVKPVQLEVKLSEKIITSASDSWRILNISLCGRFLSIGTIIWLKVIAVRYETNH